MQVFLVLNNRNFDYRLYFDTPRTIKENGIFVVARNLIMTSGSILDNII